MNATPMTGSTTTGRATEHEAAVADAPTAGRLEYGTWCFVELQTPNPAAANMFYGGVFASPGADSQPPAASACSFPRDGVAVAALADDTARWVPYVLVDSVEEKTAHAQALEATIVTAPATRSGIGRHAVLRDPFGAIIGLCEAPAPRLPYKDTQPGAVRWIELLGGDKRKAGPFYAELFGWTYEDTPNYGIRYAMFQREAESVAGLLPSGLITALLGADPLRPQQGLWHVMFAVNDCDAGVAAARALGGVCDFGPRLIPSVGETAFLADPNGAAFALIRPPLPDERRERR